MDQIQQFPAAALRLLFRMPPVPQVGDAAAGLQLIITNVTKAIIRINIIVLIMMNTSQQWALTSITEATANCL